MRIGAYQFAVTGETNQNLENIISAMSEAAKQKIRLLIFPECALTGYPPHDIRSSAEVNDIQLSSAYERIQDACNRYDMYAIVGTITSGENRRYNSAIVFMPDKFPVIYNKRALWGWDKENFGIKETEGIFEVDGFKVGVRICYEVRFPEYFRELYTAHTDLNVILFYDVSTHDDMDRYDLIKAHIRTRAVENVCNTLTVNTAGTYQTAPTALYDRSGHTLMELKRHDEGLLMYDLQNSDLNFGERGRREISDSFLY